MTALSGWGQYGPDVARYHLANLDAIELEGRTCVCAQCEGGHIGPPL